MSDDKTRVLLGGEEKKFDTQPMLEAILEGLGTLTQEVKELRDAVEKGFRLIDRRFEQIAGDANKLRAEVRDLDDRVGKLEQKPS